MGAARDSSVVVRVNGIMECRGAGITLADLVDARARRSEQRRVAASVNGAVVPRRRWSSVELSDGDGVAILMLVHSR